MKCEETELFPSHKPFFDPPPTPVLHPAANLSLALCAAVVGSEVVEYSVMQSESGEPLWLVARRELEEEPWGQYNNCHIIHYVL